MWSRISSLVTRMDTSTGTWPLLFARSITVTCGRHLREKGDIRCISAHWTQGFHHGCDPSILSFCFCLFSLLVCSSCFLFFFLFPFFFVCMCVYVVEKWFYNSCCVCYTCIYIRLALYSRDIEEGSNVCLILFIQ